MSYACDICNKGKQYGHNVSFSQRKTGKVWKPNLQRHRITVGTTRLQVKVCTQCLRTLAKYQKQEHTAAAPATDAAAEAVASTEAAKKTATTSDAKTKATKPSAKKVPAAK
ncbi:MAG TPA: 50S ribosomal protein L28 [Candidatus Saccharimonadales bacterium]|nr:50S ribosomal protein L28 [Candidatus Saccharimonadales bacterium]